MQGTPAVALGDESVFQAANRMATLRLPCIPVLDDDGQLLGILTAWDVQTAHPNRLVIDAMSARPVPISAAASIWEAYGVAGRESGEYLAVMEDERYLGIVSRTDLEVAIARFTDALTGLPTVSYLRYRIEETRRSETDVCLVFLDINDFGSLNKRLGHDVGDRALRLVTRILVSELDPARDCLCRYGGDEFAFLTTRSGADSRRFAGSLIDKIATVSEQEGLTLSVAVGIAGGRRRSSRQSEPISGDSLINLASRASTEAKRIRDGVILVEAPAPA